MLEHLWAGWRATYVASVGPEASVGGSLFTQILRSGLPDEQTNIVHRGRSCFAILNTYPYAVGHTMVLPYREVAELEDLDAAETAELWATVTDVVRAAQAGVPARRRERRTQPRPPGRRQCERTPARPYRSPLDR